MSDMNTIHRKITFLPNLCTPLQVSINFHNFEYAHELTLNYRTLITQIYEFLQYLI